MSTVRESFSLRLNTILRLLRSFWNFSVHLIDCSTLPQQLLISPSQYMQCGISSAGKISCSNIAFQSVGSGVFSTDGDHSSLRALTSARRSMKTHNTANISSAANRNARHTYTAQSPHRAATNTHNRTRNAL